MIGVTPDLIVEATAVCNRACAGCYAPNLVSGESSATLFQSRPDLFLSLNDLEKVLKELSERPQNIFIRGGEPSLHPLLAEILATASQYSPKVLVETHARWVLPSQTANYTSILNSIKSCSATIKISFDKMHGLSVRNLRSITEYLNANEIHFQIAITEKNDEEMRLSRNLCSWVSDDQIIYQQKAFSEAHLIKPRIGIIAVNGRLQQTLTHKFNADAELRTAIA